MPALFTYWEVSEFLSVKGKYCQIINSFNTFVYFASQGFKVYKILMNKGVKTVEKDVKTSYTLI